MVFIPGAVPTPLPEAQPEHHDHYLPDNEWGAIVRGAQAARAESSESETDFTEDDFDDAELED